MFSDTRRPNDVSESIPTILATLTELTKKSSNFEELREMIPLISDLKKSENHNREMNNILAVMEKALCEIKSNYSSTSRTVSTCANTLDRMANQITNEINKIHHSLERLEANYGDLQSKLKETIISQSQQAKYQINHKVEMNHKKMKDFIARQENQLSIGLPLSSNPFKLGLLRQKIQNNQKNQEQYKECEILFGEISCLKAHLHSRKRQNRNINNNDSQDQIDRFIQQCSRHFQRQYPFVVSRLKEFEQMPNLNTYQQGIFHQCYAWATRLRVSLEAAIIKLTLRLKQTLQITENHPRVQAWQQTLGQWQNMRCTLNTLLQ